MTKLGELISPGGRRAGKDVGLPVYSVTKHRGFVPSLEYFNKQVFAKDLSTYKKVSKGEFAYATIHLDEGSIGVAPEDGLISPMYTIFTADASRVDTSFLIRFLKSPSAIARYATLGRGTAERRKSISLAALGQLNLRLPPLPEQRRIADILDRADNLRAQRRRALDLIGEARVGIYHQMFDEQAWDQATLGELLDRIDGGTSPVCLERPGSSDEWAVLKLSAVTSGRYEPQFNKAIGSDFTPRDVDEVQAGDVLLTRKNTPELVGASTYVFETESKKLLPDLIFRLVPIEQKISSLFLQQQIAMPEGRRELRKLASGSAASMSNISKTRLSNLPVDVPPLALQNQFEDRVRKLEVIRGTIAVHLAKLDELFASLQHRAFQGEL